MTKADLSIIIVGYNTKTVLSDCLRSIQKSKKDGCDWEVIVVDNASSDDSVKMLKNHFSWVKVIANKKNLGFAKANNIGVKEAKGRRVLFLNPDTILEDNVLSGTLKYMDEHQDVAVVSPKVLLASGRLDEASHRGFPTPWNAFCHFSGLRGLFPKSQLFAGYTIGWQLDSESPHEVDSVVGAFYLVRREAGEQIGWWDEDYFWYGDELDFSYRLKQIGWKIIFLPYFKMLHLKGVSSGIKGHSKTISTASRQTRLRAAKASTEAMKIFYRKHYRTKYPALVRWLVFFGIDSLQLLRHFRYAIF